MVAFTIFKSGFAFFSIVSIVSMCIAVRVPVHRTMNTNEPKLEQRLDN